MKKVYVKPYLAVESFQLNAAIATSCSSNGAAPLNHTAHTCDDMDELGLGYFGEMCDDNVFSYGGDLNDTICYHGPIAPDTYLQS